MTTEPGQIDLYEFLTESELQHYYNSFKNELKIKSASQFKYATDEDLKQIGLSRPEIRRLRKYYEKYYPHGYFSKFKRLLQTPTITKRDDGSTGHHSTSADGSTLKSGNSPSKAPNNKHIIPADSICVNKQLGTGEFGIVQQGVWTNGTERIQVAIKCLCRERMQSNPMEFLKEAAIMHSIEHENIVRLYGVVLATDSLMLVTELAHLRSLLECLKDSGLRVSFLTIPTLCEFAMQICNGMKYLENKRLIHRDLAARNILVFSKNKVKISDFGLSRALGVGKDYYKTNFNVNLKLPIAWCAPECINYLRFTNASDVWAYGVCLWEMFSYGFQPWAALTGLQILEAIDEPNYQRLEQPDCCPRDYYNLMMKCWQHDPSKRPKFSEIHEMLLELKPEQLKTIVNSCEPKKDHLIYRQGEIITVLERNTNTPFWRGVLNSGKTGLFNPANTIAYIETPPNTNRESFYRNNERCSKRKLRTEMISRPQGDFKHTGHIGIDGESFGDVAFLGNSQSYNHLPRQVVTPYKPSEDIEQTPLLLPPTPTSPDSLQTASGYFPDEIRTSSSTNPTFISSNENTPNHHNTFDGPSFDFSSTSTLATTTNSSKPIFHSSTNPFALESSTATTIHARAAASSSNSSSNSTFALQNNNYGLEASAFINANLEDDSLQALGGSNVEDQHEYHEISDDEITADKVFDMGPSLLDEFNSVFGIASASATATIDSMAMSKSPDLDHGHKKHDLSELSSKLNRKNSGDSNGNKSKKKSSATGTMKPISVKDEKILNHAIEIANEISARSMTDLVSDQPANVQSPKRKFSFRFPHLSHHGVSDKHNAGPSAGFNGNAGTLSYSKEKKNFTEELKSIPDLQNTITEEGREAYNSLIERKSTINFISTLDTNEFELTTAKTLPRRSVHLKNEVDVLAMETSLRNQQGQLTVPLQDAPRPMTLPNRGFNGKLRKSELITNPKFFPLKQRPKTLAGENDENSPANSNNSGQAVGSDKECESPSYLTNTFYTFPEKNVNKTNGDDSPQADQSDSTNSNPIPLPPRDRNKVIKTNPKRHVRKYPLIIPAYGVQRTLNKVTEITPDDEPKDPFPGTPTDKNLNHLPLLNDPNNLKKFTHEPVSAVVRPTSRHSDSFEKPSETRTYQNLQEVHNETNTDSASLQFESILEDDFNQVDMIASPDVTDGFYNFSIQKEQYNKSKEVDFNTTKISGLYVNEDELRNLDIEKKKVPFVPPKTTSTPAITTSTASTALVLAKPITTTTPTTTTTGSGNELAGHALFNKIRESVDMAMNKSQSSDGSRPSSRHSSKHEVVETPIELENEKEEEEDEEKPPPPGALIKDSNSVSCEDLLEFSDKKPKGCERGVDSDEVRIMMKVLGKDSTPTRCLHVLEFIEWDVHKAIKLIKLQNILNTIDLNLTESVEALQKYDWDLQITAMKLKGHK